MIDPKLKAKWKAKLKASGFKDIENDYGMFVDGGEYHSSKFQRLFKSEPGKRKNGIKLWEDRTRYYDLCRDFLNTHNFRRRSSDKRMFELHSEGMGEQEIANVIYAHRPDLRSRSRVRIALTKLRTKMLGHKP
jgi:hypothetical protein